MNLYFNNLLDSVAVTCSSERSGFPAVNVQHPHLSMRWRSNTPDAQYLLFDAGAGNVLTADMCAILAHNLTSSAITTFKMNDTDSWGAPSLSVSLDPTQEVMLEKFAQHSHRLARYDFDDPTNPDLYVEVGRAWAGLTLSIIPAMIVDYPVTIVCNDSTSYGITRQKYSDIGDQWRRFEFSFPPTEATLIAQLKAMFTFVGNNQSLIVAPVDPGIDPSGLFDPCYVGVVGSLKFQHHSRLKKWVYSLTLEEEK